MASCFFRWGRGSEWLPHQARSYLQGLTHFGTIPRKSRKETGLARKPLAVNHLPEFKNFSGRRMLASHQFFSEFPKNAIQLLRWLGNVVWLRLAIAPQNWASAKRKGNEPCGRRDQNDR